MRIWGKIVAAHVDQPYHADSLIKGDVISVLRFQNGCGFFLSFPENIPAGNGQFGSRLFRKGGGQGQKQQGQQTCCYAAEWLSLHPNSSLSSTNPSR